MSGDLERPIRLLGAEDEAQYRALWLSAITESPQYFRTSPQDAGVERFPTRGEADSFTLGAFSGQTLLGAVSLERDAPLKLRHKALVSRMFVAPHAAGAGIGRALLERLIEDARRAPGLRQIHLTVLATNQRAIGLYASLGFTEFAREPQAVEVDGAYVDELRMVRFL